MVTFHAYNLNPSSSVHAACFWCQPLITHRVTMADAATDDLAFFVRFLKVFSLEGRSIVAFLFAGSTDFDTDF